MKIIISIFVLLCISIYSFGQQVFRYTYDASGNRTVRQYTASLFSLEEEDEEELFSRMFNQHQIKLQTDPSGFIIDVIITNYKAETQGKISLYDINGICISSTIITSEKTSIDIRTLSKGIYIIKITVNEENRSWKLTKS